MSADGRDDRRSVDPVVRASADDGAFARMLDAALAGDEARLAAPGDLAARVLLRLEYRPGDDRPTPTAAQRGVAERARRLARSPGAKRVLRRSGHASALVLVILGGFMINNTLPSAVHSAPTTVPCAVERGLERQGARIDGLLRELNRSGPAFFVPAPSVPVDEAAQPPRGSSNGRATAPYRWV